MVGQESMPFGPSKSLLIFTSSSPQSRRLGICHVGRWLADTSVTRITKSRSRSLAEVGAGSLYLRKSIFPHHSLLSSHPLPVMATEKNAAMKEACEHQEQEQEQEQKQDAQEVGSRPEIVADVGEPPEKPLPGDCCGQGCTRCVWDVYSEELADYKKRLGTS